MIRSRCLNAGFKFRPQGLNALAQERSLFEQKILGVAENGSEVGTYIHEIFTGDPAYF